MSNPRLRLTLAMTTLALSVALLAWGLIPLPRQFRHQRIKPAEMQVPVTVKHHGADKSLSFVEHHSIEQARVLHGADYVVLIL